MSILLSYLTLKSVLVVAYMKNWYYSVVMTLWFSYESDIVFQAHSSSSENV